MVKHLSLVFLIPVGYAQFVLNFILSVGHNNSTRQHTYVFFFKLSALGSLVITTCTTLSPSVVRSRVQLVPDHLLPPPPHLSHLLLPPPLVQPEHLLQLDDWQLVLLGGPGRGGADLGGVRGGQHGGRGRGHGVVVVAGGGGGGGGGTGPFRTLLLLPE